MSDLRNKIATLLADNDAIRVGIDDQGSRHTAMGFVADRVLALVWDEIAELPALTVAALANSYDAQKYAAARDLAKLFREDA